MQKLAKKISLYLLYIRSANISVLSQEMVRRDLSEIILSAQSRGEKITDVISGDLKEFCDEVISNREMT
jgi:DNA-binding ferritin-like protein (Dps family)